MKLASKKFTNGNYEWEGEGWCESHLCLALCSCLFNYSKYQIHGRDGVGEGGCKDEKNIGDRSVTKITNIELLQDYSCYD
jgi:hypothetical protein